MKNVLLEKVEEIINTLACNEKQPIEVRGAFNAAINLRAMLEQITAEDMPAPIENKKEEPSRWTLPEEDSKPKKGRE